jgi:hypothetical protein
MRTHMERRWRHLAAIGLALLVAAAVAGVATLALSVWAAASLGVIVGQVVSSCLEAWDDRYFPDRVVIMEARLE